jgi:hypothetical protein
MKEAEFVQRNLLEVLIQETEKGEGKRDKTIINQVSKTIADNSSSK